MWAPNQESAHDALIVEKEDACQCGCGEVGIEGRETAAILLKMSRQTAQHLRERRKVGGITQEKADGLLWTYDRFEGYFEDYVHNLFPYHPPPLPIFLAYWREEAMRL